MVVLIGISLLMDDVEDLLMCLGSFVPIWSVSIRNWRNYRDKMHL